MTSRRARGCSYTIVLSQSCAGKLPSSQRARATDYLGEMCLHQNVPDSMASLLISVFRDAIATGDITFPPAHCKCVYHIVALDPTFFGIGSSQKTWASCPGVVCSIVVKLFAPRDWFPCKLFLIARNGFTFASAFAFETHVVHNIAWATHRKVRPVLSHEILNVDWPRQRRMASLPSHEDMMRR